MKAGQDAPPPAPAADGTAAPPPADGAAPAPGAKPAEPEAENVAKLLNADGLHLHNICFQSP
jgi:hypothetical protein